MQLSERGLGRGVEMNLILDIDTGYGCQDCLEGSKCFGWPLREFNRKCGTPKSPVNSASPLN